jgi:hypothetical protein
LSRRGGSASIRIRVLPEAEAEAKLEAAVRAGVHLVAPTSPKQLRKGSSPVDIDEVATPPALR